MLCLESSKFFFHPFPSLDCEKLQILREKWRISKIILLKLTELVRRFNLPNERTFDVFTSIRRFKSDVCTIPDQL